jgi:hypothetical protein
MPKYLKLWKCPKYYIGKHWPEYYVVTGRNRDSGLLDNHNFDVIVEALREVAEKMPDWKEKIWDKWLISPYESHWAVGWVEWIGIHKDAPPQLIDTADKLLGELEDYPTLNEDELSEKEWTAAQEFWERMSVKERLELCQKNRCSIFAARHPWIPQDDNGGIFEDCRPE